MRLALELIPVATGSGDQAWRDSFRCHELGRASCAWFPSEDSAVDESGVITRETEKGSRAVCDRGGKNPKIFPRANPEARAKQLSSRSERIVIGERARGL
jgi:hypothetical protein